MATAAELRRNVNVVREFIAAAEAAGLFVPVPLKIAVSTFDAGVVDVGEAFENVCTELERYNRDFEASLRSRYDMRDPSQADDYFIELAKHAHRDNYQAQAVRSVLGNTNASMAGQVWAKWRTKLQEVLRDRTTNVLREWMRKMIQ